MRGELACFFRGLQHVVAFVCGLAVLVLLLIALASSTWLDSEGFQQGLWFYCVRQGFEGPLPPLIPERVGCHTEPYKVYILVTGALCAAALLLDFMATFLLGIALCMKKIDRKIKLYKMAKSLFFIALLSAVSGLTLFAVQFSLEYRQWGRRSFEFGWAFGMAWGAVVFLFGTLLLLCCDQETDNVYYAAKSSLDDS
ncbi:hypothetical protein RvY_17646-2 [Ramazzottius varieornatus]|uniref:Transmembrane protein 47 n=1 Tax=Ramazzottius varieornatus TaxID=947166 RepID=A0A1D1W2V5_RAMVA|nr:hypothetical protein RvY_17646-2 [Ramazzottius varieornatus]